MMPVIDWRLRRQLDKARSRMRQVRMLTVASLVWIVGAALAGSLWFAQHRWHIGLPRPAETLSFLAIGAWFVAMAVVLRMTRNLRRIAQRVEDAFPDLNSSLLTAMDIQPDVMTGRVGYLQDIVIGQVLSHAYRHGWERIVSIRRLALAHFWHVTMFALFAASLWQLRNHAKQVVMRPGPNSPNEVGSRDQFQVTIEPGDTEIERGTSLLVLARFQGSLPPDATLVYRQTESTANSTSAAETETETESGRVPMSKALDDPLFGGSVAIVDKPLEYHVEYTGQQTQTFRVDVFEYPRLSRADVHLEFPRYTSLADKLVKDVRHVSALTGTKITLILEVNKPLVTARLTEKDSTPLELKAVPDKPLQYSVVFTLDRTHRYAVELVDDRQRTNKEAAELLFTALSNQPPDLKLAAPAKDTQVSPLEELELKAKAFDDFGLQRAGLTYVMAGQPEQELTLAQQVAGKEKLELTHVVALERLKAEPDQLLSYYFWAEDAGPDGSTRRTASDMFFAEVRPFEEIFRQGQQPPGGEQQQPASQSPNANAAEKLAELQKEIINATWKLVRRETRQQPTSEFPSDVALLIESQNTALQQTEGLAEKIRDAQALRHVDAARRHMNQAVQELLEAKEKMSATTLRPALDAEQQAYQALLKLRAREHQVVQGQQQAGSSRSASSRSQQQLDQLELKDQKNRYESERAAQQEQDPAEREMRQVLNRLKELARRQGDLNERVKELQTALQEAKAEEQKEELRRQLKRLQEEQEQLLRDTEELQARMDQPQNAEQMAESRQQLDDARERVRQSSEALREGMVSQAASAGSRAKEDFEQLRDEFRKQTAGQFQDEVRELSEQARELDEREQKIAEQLQQLQNPKQPTTSLRDGGEREKLLQGFDEQKNRSHELLEKMRQTIQEAEGPQPLLAEQLYDTVRRVQQKNLPKNLETAQEAIRRGLMEPARQQEQAARNTIGELRAGIDRAAENVLADETEALRRAQDQLAELSSQVHDELTRNGQSPPDAATREESDSTKSNPQEPEAGSQPSRGQPSGDPSKSQTGKASGSRPDSDQKSGKESSGKDGQASSSGGSPKGTSPEGQPEGNQPSAAKGAPGSPGGGDPASPNRSPGEPGRRGTPGSTSPSVGGFEQLAGPPREGGTNRSPAPFGGEDFRSWSDRLRDVEEMLGDPQLSAEAARIRERARALRAESTRHSVAPNWDLVKVQVAEPLAELLDRVHTEVLKRTKSDLLVPLDRDPVPPEYAEQVRKYYEQLGTGK